jgi:hypothetical protein
MSIKMKSLQPVNCFSRWMRPICLSILFSSVVSLPGIAQELQSTNPLLDHLSQSKRASLGEMLEAEGNLLEEVSIISALPRFVPSANAERANNADANGALLEPAVQPLALEPDPLKPDPVQLDPLNSPHPVPWNWVLATHQQASELNQAGTRYYRSPSLISPDGEYAAYSRIQLHVEPELYRSRVSSVMFLENLRNGDLQMVAAASSFAEHLLLTRDRILKPGAIAMMVPVSWTEDSHQMLAREFEGFFSSSDISDYAVVWDRETREARTVAPTHDTYSTAILLGWSDSNPDQVLFQAGSFGEQEWSLWSVDLQGQTYFASSDRPLVVGQQVTTLLSGPQAYYSP